MASRSIASLDLGGVPAFDFANTVNSRVVTTHDYLGSYADIVAWLAHAGLLPEGAERSVDVGAESKHVARAALVEGLALRDTIYRAFSALARRVTPADDDVRDLLAAFGRSVARIVPNGGLVSVPRWSPTAGPDGLLDPVRFSAGSLLLDPDRPRVGECPGCGWLFLDVSRNQRRRWCDMRTCGSRDKMRRYRGRAPAARKGGSR